MRVRVYLTGKGVRVHHADCRDCKVDARRSDSFGGVEEFDTRLDLVADFYADQITEDPEYDGTEDSVTRITHSYMGEFQFLPCLKGGLR